MSLEPEAYASRTPTSPPSTPTVFGEPNDLSVLQPTGSSPVAETAAALEKQLEALKTERKQERFFWVFTTTGLGNATLSMVLPVYGELIFLSFSILLLLGCARWMEVPWLVWHLERWFERASATAGKDETE